MRLSGVLFLDTSQAEVAKMLASRFSVSLIDAVHLAGAKAKWIEAFLKKLSGGEAPAAFLMCGWDGLELYMAGAGYGHRIRADFCGPEVTYRRLKGGGRRQAIARSVGLRAGASPSVLDATAGLGGDAFVLASLGCRVSLFERVPVVHALLVDALERGRAFASERPEHSELRAILERMQVRAGDACAFLKACTAAEAPDVVYLDPMFPHRSKSALVKKEMRIFQALVGPDADAEQLLGPALAVAQKRVVVKRPRLAAPLGAPHAPSPSHGIEGKTSRFDIYMRL